MTPQTGASRAAHSISRGMERYGATSPRAGRSVLSAAIWLVVLSRVSLSFAYPFVSLTYVIILVFDRLVLHESVSGVRWVGVALIMAGILLISRTHQSA